MPQKVTISVVGSHDCNDEVGQLAHDVGRIIAKVGAVLVCGGREGTMMEASRGAQEAGGLTIGLLPSTDKAEANPFIEIALPTSLGFARNACVAAAADIIVALPGSHGTRSEISFGLVWGRPVIDLGGWGIDGMIKVSGTEEAEDKIRELMKGLPKSEN